MLAVEPAAPMSAITTELDILDETNEFIISKDWRGEYLKLSPSCVRDGQTIYRICAQSFNLNEL